MDASRCALALVLVAALSLAAAAGCGDRNGAGQESPEPEVEASCALVVEYDGHRYLGNGAPMEPVEGKPLGSATVPACQDTPNEDEPEDEEVEVAEIAGVPPDVAIMMRGRPDTVLLRDDVDAERLPSQVKRLLGGSS